MNAEMMTSRCLLDVSSMALVYFNSLLFASLRLESKVCILMFTTKRCTDSAGDLRPAPADMLRFS